MKFITNEPALVIDDILVIGDLHLGIETEFYRNGFSISSNIEKIKNKILALSKSNDCKKIVMLGDVKHDYRGTSRQEEREIPPFFSELSKYLEIHIAPGNHDGNLKNITPKTVNIHKSSGFKMGRNFFAHGHSWPGKSFLDSDAILIAHNHPSVEFKDKLGYRHLEPCWIKCELNRDNIMEKYKEKGRVKEAVVVPVFNPLVGGLPVNKEKSDMGPLMKNKIIERKECRVYLLDGTYLGKVRDLKS